MTKIITLRYQSRIYLTDAQEQLANRLFGCKRKVFNHFLDLATKAYELYKTTDDKSHLMSLSYFALSAELTKLKQQPEFSYLNDVCAQSLQRSVRDLAVAFANFFRKKKGYPRFKSRFHGYQTAEFSNQSCRVKDDKLYVTGISGSIRIKLSRPLPDNYTDSTITRTPSGKYFVSFIVKVERKKLNGQGTVGIDLGLTNLVTFSDGQVIDNPKRYLDYEKKIARLQRRLARTKFKTDEQGKKVPSSGRIKAKLALAKAFERLTNIKKDYLHKLTTGLVKTYQSIGMESLRVGNMMKNHKLAKHIAGANWGMFRKMLSDKCQQYSGCTLVFADPFFPSSKLCSSCGHKYGQLTLQERKWTCLHCATHHDRDVNAARNLEKLAKDWGSFPIAKEQGFILASEPRIA